MKIDSISLLAGQVGTNVEAGVRHSRLVHAAQQFEGVMLGELMKPLASGAAIGEDPEAGSQNPMQSYGVEAMAGALASSGALGFAARMVHAVEK